MQKEKREREIDRYRERKRVREIEKETDRKVEMKEINKIKVRLGLINEG